MGAPSSGFEGGLLNLFLSSELLNLPLNLWVSRPRVLREELLNLLPSREPLEFAGAPSSGFEGGAFELFPSREPRYRFTASISTNPGSPLA